MSKYIDADKAIKDYAHYGIKHFYDATDLEAILNECPAADVVEVRHGRWEETTTLNLWECSVCGQMIYSETVLDRKTFHKWCGNCGAKMDEVEDNG